MHDIIKDPIKASLFYREEGLRAIARRDKEAAFYWRLVLDVVQQVIIQSYDYSIITPRRSSFVHQVTQLALSTYEARASLERTLDQTDHNWSFQRNIPKKIFTHYCYWVFFLIKSASTTFDLEINQLHKALEKYQKYAIRDVYDRNDTENPIITSVKSVSQAPVYNDNVPRDKVSKMTASRAKETDKALVECMPSKYVSDPKVEFNDLPGTDMIFDTVKKEKGQPCIDKMNALIGELFKPAGIYSKSYIEAILKGK